MTPPMLQLEDVVAGYGPTTVLNNLSFDLHAQDRLAMVGRNGVGKTTALRAIMGLVPLRSGRISFRGQDISALPPQVQH